MQKYIRALQEYCKQNPPNHGDAQSVMNLLYWTYTEYNPIDDKKLKNGFAKLRAQFPHLSLQEFGRCSIPLVIFALTMSGLRSMKDFAWESY